VLDGRARDDELDVQVAATRVGEPQAVLPLDVEDEERAAAAVVPVVGDADVFSVEEESRLARVDVDLREPPRREREVGGRPGRRPGSSRLATPVTAEKPPSKAADLPRESASAPRKPRSSANRNRCPSWAASPAGEAEPSADRPRSQAEGRSRRAEYLELPPL